MSEGLFIITIPYISTERMQKFDFTVDLKICTYFDISQANMQSNSDAV